MKIYLVVTPFFPEFDSFRGPYIYDQVNAIIKTGKYDKVIVLKPCRSNKLKDYIYDDIPVYRFKTWHIPSNALPGMFDNMTIRSFLNKIKDIGIRIADIDVVHSHVTDNAIYAIALKRINPNIKTILQHHGFDVLNLELGCFADYKWHKKLVIRYGTNICNNIDLHVGVSGKTLSYLRAYDGIQIKDSYILYNGVDTSKFHPITGLRDKNKFTIGCIGNFSIIKDQITLIKAVKILHKDKGCDNIIVKFIGSGPTLQSCKDFVKENGLEYIIIFESEVDHKKLITFYNSLDLFVLPSYYEAFGCVYTEAYACGVPFIAVKGQGISELIPESENDKWLIDKEDFVSLAKHIENYMQYRYKQTLKYDINIDLLIKDFIDYIDRTI